MDKMKEMAGNMGSGQIKETLQGMHFPANKDQVINELQQRGVPSQVTDQLRKIDTKQFSSADDVMSKVKSFM